MKQVDKILKTWLQEMAESVLGKVVYSAFSLLITGESR